MRSTVVRTALTCLCLALPWFVQGRPADDKPYEANVSPASDAAEKAIKGFRVPEGLKVELFAGEPLLANPVCFAVDRKGRFYVAETFRLHDGVTDIRGHMNWLDDDLACRTIADRDQLYRKYLKDKYPTYGVHPDRVRLIEDRDGDGKADHARVFADGFKGPVEGIGAGLLARGDRVWYTCIPNLWLLRDSAGTGKAESKKALSTGYGVHTGFIGHDLHGLILGPDGKLYFTIGDRGLNVKTDSKHLYCPDSGAVLRCNPDGSDLEIYATGLRNPQELAFDQFGNLFTVDNNSDGGDWARMVHLVEGGDSGWRIGYQFLNEPVPRGPWNQEKMWEPKWDLAPAYIIPPLANFSSGPSGICFNPGVTQLPEKERDHFFLADFRGASGQSGIRSFAVKPKGATFEPVDQHEFLWSVLATDVDFGPDGALYVLDWVDGWNKPNKGRIYRLGDPARAKDPAVLEVKKLLGEGFAKRSSEERIAFLGHADQRVRQEAQFALAEMGPASIPHLELAARRGALLARVHAIWGLAQLQGAAGKSPAIEFIRELLGDKEPEVRAQATKLCRDPQLGPALAALLKDPEPRVRFCAAHAIGKLGTCDKAILDMLRDNADRDPYLRHAGVMALQSGAGLKLLPVAAGDDSAAVRMAALLAYRRQSSPDVTRFLNDSDPRLVVEAARAIYDAPIPEAMPQLAAMIAKPGLVEPLLYRVLNAQFRLGKAENAVALASFAAKAGAPEALRLEAVRLLSQWAKPSGRDRIVGLWRPLEPRSAEVAANAVKPRLAGILGASEKVRQEGVRLATRLGIKEVGPSLLEIVRDGKLSPETRAEALRGLRALKDERTAEAMQLALADDQPKLRIEGRRALATLRPNEAVSQLESALAKGELPEQQAAVESLAAIGDSRADAVLDRWLDKLLEGSAPAPMVLDLVEAASRRGTESFKKKLAKFDSSRKREDSLAGYRETLQGGDAELGRQLFHEKAEVYCLRCHKIRGEGGDVGPDLAGIAAKQTREYLLESLVDPNKQIAKGFETVVLALANGQVQSGVLKSEDATTIRLMTAEGKLVVVPKAQVEERQTGKSAMPDDVAKKLTKRELRDLIEYLASLK